MATNIVIPSLGLTMEEGIIIEWLVKEGTLVEKEDSILLIETDKATAEVVAPASGILGGIVATAGDAVPVGVKVGTIYSSQAELEEGRKATVPVVGALLQREQERTPIVAQADLPAQTPVKAIEDPFIKASPAARRLARELEITLVGISGTGPGGRILESNVSRHASMLRAESSPLLTPLAPILAEKSIDNQSYTSQPSAMRRTIARRMMESTQSTAPVTIFMEVRMDETIKVREHLNHALREDHRNLKVTYDAIFVKALALALRKHPNMQAEWSEDALIQPEGIHIGFAVSLPNGLVVPVVRHADRQSLVSISSEVARLIAVARNGQLKKEDMSGGTITISNIGKYPVIGFTPIINLPQACILGIGGIQEKAIVVNGAITVGNVAELSLTFDHQINDGIPAAAFLADIKSTLESPFKLFLEP
ncbi:dihydrolipoamide acetyltransferase family protein [Paenibacillus albus]|uniref:Dihydrolipoamide acetyltransferase component of pyruvate dehydrogenase complex n=1 Tax=Paenibacillus albus TaxID=2495582 RepID=A0A3S9A6M6_9BACL|nr:dihydrolipoamide acetyltransferase family protein [Paenibacillus albus]AZN41375.1 2-oxo acid dehydrogenase subunit E2 [Paenibacillus albus]